MDVPLELATQPWFLCLFIGYVPLGVSLKIMDSLFNEGSNLLFCVALSILKMKETIILRQTQSDQILFHMKERVPVSLNQGTDELLQTAFTYLDALPMDKITELRNIHKSEAIKNIEKKNRTKTIQELKEKTKFEVEELVILYDTFQAVAFLDTDIYIEYEEFCRIFTQCIPEWKEANIPNLSDFIFQAFDRKSRGRLDLYDFILGLDALKKSDFDNQFQFCFHSLSSKTNSITKKNFQYVVELFLRIHKIEINKEVLGSINSFVIMTFEKFGQHNDEDSISWEDLEQTIIKKPLLSEWYNTFMMAQFIVQ